MNIMGQLPRNTYIYELSQLTLGATSLRLLAIIVNCGLKTNYLKWG